MINSTNAVLQRMKPWWCLLVCMVLGFPRVSISAQAVEVTLASTNNPGSLPIFVAEAKGLFADEGVKVRILPCSIGRQCLRMVLDGKAQLGTVADLPVALAAFGNESFALVATMNTNRNDTKVITRRSSGIKQLSDLAGKSVGTYIGTTAHYALDSQLLKNRQDSSKLTWQSLQPGEERTRLLASSVDAVAVFEPHAYQAAQALGGDVVVLDNLNAYTQTWNLVTGPSPRRPDDDTLMAVLRALGRACELIKKDRVYARALLRERTGMSAELIAHSWSAWDFELSLKPALLSTLKGEAQWGLKQGLVQGTVPDYLRFIHSQPLRAVHQGSVTLAN